MKHASERFRGLLKRFRKRDGSEWSGQELQNATGGVVTRSYVTNLKKGRVENPGLAKLEAIAGAMGFPPQLWFAARDTDPVDPALAAALEDQSVREIVELAVRLGPRDKRALLGIARGIASSSEDGKKHGG